MGGVNNTVDKFGRQKFKDKYRSVRGPPGIGFKLTADGQYDIGGKRLTNLSEPKNGNDATTRNFVAKEVEGLRKPIASIFTETLLPMMVKNDGELKRKIDVIRRMLYGRPLADSLKAPNTLSGPRPMKKSSEK